MILSQAVVPNRKVIDQEDFVDNNYLPSKNECLIQHYVLFFDRLFLVEDNWEYRTHG